MPVCLSVSLCSFDNRRASMACVTPSCIASMIAQGSSSDPVDYVVQVVDLKPAGNRYMMFASDGTDKIKAALSSDLVRDVKAGKLDNLGLVRVSEFTINEVPNQVSKVLLIVKGEIVTLALDHEVGGAKVEEKVAPDSSSVPSIMLLKRPSDSKVMSAAQIVQEQHHNAAPAARMGISRRVYPLVSLNPYQGNWTIKVRVTGKGPMRSFKNARGEGNLFTVELTDEDATQIQATMFREAADKFFPKLELGKVYFISKGSLRVANKLYSTVKNDYEMTLNVNSEVEEVPDGGIKIPEVFCRPVKIDELGPHVNGRELVDVIGVVQSVASVASIRRKSNNEEIPKRDVTIADDSKKTVTVSLWNSLALKEGEQLLNMLNDSPTVLIKGLRVSDFQGVSLSTTQNSLVLINPDVKEAQKLRLWFSGEGKDAQLTAAGASLPQGGTRNGARSLYSEREFISEIIKPNVGEEKPAYFKVRAYISFIKPDQAMWYMACQSCNRKVTEELGSRFWCEGCQKHYDNFSRRYIMTVKVSDFTGEAWASAFNEQAEVLLGHSADELADIKSQDSDMKVYQAELKKAMWVPLVFQISVAQTEYMNEKRQRITIRSVAAMVWVEESKFLLEQIAKLKDAS